MSSLFAAVLGVNPVQHLLRVAGVLRYPARHEPAGAHRQAVLPRADLRAVPSWPGVVFAVAIALAALRAVASLLRGGRFVHTDPTSQTKEKPVPGTLPAIDNKKTALLVMDYQAGVLDRIGDADALLGRVAQAIELVRDRGGQIGYVRVAFEDADYAAIPATSMMGTRVAGAGRAFHADSPLTAIDDRIAPQPGDVLVRKTRVGAFSTTDLDDQLRRRGVDTLLLAGLSTSGVLLSTVRDAHDRDYRVFVVADLSADPEPGVHDFLTERIFPRQAYVITSAELGGLLAADGADGA